MVQVFLDTFGAKKIPFSPIGGKGEFMKLFKKVKKSPAKSRVLKPSFESLLDSIHSIKVIGHIIEII